MISFNAGFIRARDPMRKQIEDDLRRTTVPITVVAPSQRAVDHSKSTTTQQRDETSFRKAKAIHAERKAADKARKSKPAIRTLGEVVRRNRRRSNG